MPLSDRPGTVLRIALLSFVVSGCGGTAKPATSPLLQVDLPRRHLPSLIMSEAQEGGTSEIEEVFELKNPTAGILDVAILSKNCTCVDVQADGRRLGGREELAIPASQSRSVKITRPIVSGGGVLSAEVTLQVKGEKKSQQEAISLSVDREIVPDICSVPLVIRESFTDSNPAELVRSLDLSVASRDQHWLQQTSVLFEELPDGISVGDVIPISDTRRTTDGIYSRSWRIKLVLTRGQNQSYGKNFSALLRMMVQSMQDPNRIVSHDVPVSITFKNTSNPVADR